MLPRQMSPEHYIFNRSEDCSGDTRDHDVDEGVTEILAEEEDVMVMEMLVEEEDHNRGCGGGYAGRKGVGDGGGRNLEGGGYGGDCGGDSGRGGVGIVAYEEEITVVIM